MTKKRFTIKEFSTLDAMSSLDVICDKGIELPSSTACDLLNELHEENRRLKSQLCYNGSDVCDICKHQYLVKSENYYIAKCEKGHEECSKEDIRYCKDFELKGDVE